MVALRLASLFGLVTLFVLAQIATFVYKITRNRFYAPFHFSGGFLSATLLYSIYGNLLLALLGTVGIGVLWEIYEYLLWRFVLKDDKYKQEKQDTINDIVLDFGGGLTALLIFLLLNLKL